LILLLYQTGLRISEALSLTTAKIEMFEEKPILRFTGKGKKERAERLADKLKAYAYEKKIGPQDRFFPINRQRAWQIIKEVAKKAKITKRVYPHPAPPGAFIACYGNEVFIYFDSRRFFANPATG